MQTLETIALACCGGGTKRARSSVQNALLSPIHHHHSRIGDDEKVDAGESLSPTASADGLADPGAPADGNDGDATATGDRNDNDAIAERGGEKRSSNCCQSGAANQVGTMECFRQGRGNGDGGAGGTGATAFALRLADSYSHDDSRTIVRRAGAARVAASAFCLVRALLTDWKGIGGGSGERLGCQDEANGEGKGQEREQDDREEALVDCIDEFYEEQVPNPSRVCLCNRCVDIGRGGYIGRVNRQSCRSFV